MYTYGHIASPAYILFFASAGMFSGTMENGKLPLAIHNDLAQPIAGACYAIAQPHC